MRKLAHVEKIVDIQPIPNADKIEVATVLGWKVVIKKDEFKVGDKIIYIEIDSRVPKDEPYFSFLADRNYKVKSIKLRKQVSQGLIVPMSLLPYGDYQEGDDVTDILKITKIEDDYKQPPVNKELQLKQRHKKLYNKKWFKYMMKYTWFRKLAFKFLLPKKRKTGWPSWITKTDEERCLYGDVKIDTHIGKVRIADIVNKKLKLDIKSYNLATGDIEYKPIESYQKIKCNEPLYDIEYVNKHSANRKNRLICTGDHYVYTKNGYKKCIDLNLNDEIYIFDKIYDTNIYKYIYGMILGDAHLKFDNRTNGLGKNDNFAISLCHGEKQLDYLKSKLALFGSDNVKILQGRSGYAPQNKIYKASIPCDYGLIYHIKDELGCIKNNKFNLNQKFCDLLTPESLAIWYMDDGTIKHKSDSDNQSPSINISSYSFTKEENEMLINTLQNKFGIECNLRKEKEYWSIYITVAGTPKFLQLITPFIHPSMRYKTLTEYENMPYVLYDQKFYKEEKLIPRQITSINLYTKNKTKFVYDITVQDNHNFFANNLLTHNCQNMPWVLQDKSPFFCTEKLDGTSSTFSLHKEGMKWKFYVCSRNVVQDTPGKKCYYEDLGNVYWEMAKKYDIENKLRAAVKDYNVKDYITLQGEIIGGGIQKNKYELKGRDLYLFNLIVDDVKYNPVQVAAFALSYDMKAVPILETEFVLPDTVDELMEFATGNSTLHNTLREGIVFRSHDMNTSFKCVSNKFLLKWGL